MNCSAIARIFAPTMNEPIKQPTTQARRSKTLLLQVVESQKNFRFEVSLKILFQLEVSKDLDQYGSIDLRIVKIRNHLINSS